MVEGQYDLEDIFGWVKIYFFIFEYYLCMYGLFEMLKYLLIVEFFLCFVVFFFVGVVGFWQFVLSIVCLYGFIVNGQVDECLDLYCVIEVVVCMLVSFY